MAPRIGPEPSWKMSAPLGGAAKAESPKLSSPKLSRDSSEVADLSADDMMLGREKPFGMPVGDGASFGELCHLYCEPPRGRPLGALCSLGAGLRVGLAMPPCEEAEPLGTLSSGCVGRRG
eukprot:CAMPEP_0177259680 /NCGR_PEP_ID=MMETSP0367-20130122/58785_1 /TAXON_ID=447022 ORGANISM="Scrippsiella hangoei-like, Strain SHHI-4" /NCGR_SAMPLE_ID=MMETSP0367 /ASSEMBLY_ACC=CAM_ASM_000362 /LENGTH=119 /DNA_ID=CAMNT_0018714009 /DNA_START=83 /DNA_END=438 /DNA_ORIENTATION=+